jgi:hypothetical protein
VKRLYFLHLSDIYDDDPGAMKTLSSQLDPALLARSKRYEKLTLLLRQHLPPECDSHYSVTGIQQQELVIMADSPVWATRLRQLAPQIVEIARQQLTQLQHVQIKTHFKTTTGPSTTSPARTTAPKRHLSQSACQQITSAASGITDEGLKNALLKLARHQQKPGA